MKFLKYIITTMLLLTTLLMAGCGEDKWVGTWYNKEDNYISKSVVTKEKNRDKTYNDAEWIMGYVEEKVDTGKTSNGTPIYNFRYNWTDKFVLNVQLTEKDGKLTGTYKDIGVEVEYNEKDKTLLSRASNTSIVNESFNEKNFDVKKVQQELKAKITKDFNEAKEKNNKSFFKLFIIGDIEFVDDPAKVPHPNG